MTYATTYTLALTPGGYLLTGPRGLERLFTAHEYGTTANAYYHANLYRTRHAAGLV